MATQTIPGFDWLRAYEKNCEFHYANGIYSQIVDPRTQIHVPKFAVFWHLHFIKSHPLVVSA
jgi:hypothetical protein